MLKSLEINKINVDMLGAKTDIVLRPVSARFKYKKKNKKQRDTSTSRRQSFVIFKSASK